jgi:hypothetical protein
MSLLSNQTMISNKIEKSKIKNTHFSPGACTIKLFTVVIYGFS